MSGVGFETFFNLGLVLFTAFLVAGVTIAIIGWMLEREVSVAQGLGAIFLAFAVLFVSASSKSTFLQAGVAFGLVVVCTVFPFARRAVNRAVHRTLDLEALEKAYEAAILRPDNIAARLAIARAVKDLGLVGHAVVIAERTLAAVSPGYDPITNRSPLDLYRADAAAARQWRQSIRDPRAFDPVRCRRCGALNPPGEIACVRCRAPFLLDVARESVTESNVLGRLVLAGAAVALAQAGLLWLAQRGLDGVFWGGSAGILILTALVLRALFPPGSFGER